jgi:hypothetical protein
VTIKVALEAPLPAEDIEEAKAHRRAWLRKFNQLKDTPGGGYHYIAELAEIEETIETLDAIIAAQPHVH